MLQSVQRSSRAIELGLSPPEFRRYGIKPGFVLIDRRLELRDHLGRGPQRLLEAIITLLAGCRHLKPFPVPSIAEHSATANAPPLAPYRTLCAVCNLP